MAASDEDAAYRAARETALRLLGRREHARVELVRKLRGKGHAAELSARVVDELASEGLQSDARFAEGHARGRYERGYGPLRIRAELGDKGVDEALIEAALAALGADWTDAARAACRKRFGDAPAADARELARRQRFLGQRGFSREQSRLAAGEPGD